MILNNMIKELLIINNINVDIPDSITEKEEMLKTLMTITPPVILNDDYIKAEQVYLSKKMMAKEVVEVETLKDELLKNIYIFKGDITCLQADAIVNAGNEKLLGCFVPGHHCIDNAIHLSAGLQLRQACNEHMIKQGYDEPCGRALVTSGFNLPSKYVVHTVGPNIHTGISQKEADELLEQCYLSVLDSVKNLDVKTVVFCSISTGIYGMDIERASEIALNTINQYLKNNEHKLSRVIINVFSQEDYNVYKSKI